MAAETTVALVEERFEWNGFALLLVSAAVGAWLAMLISMPSGALYALGLGPFLAASWSAVLILHPRMRLRLLPRVSVEAPVWACAIVWYLCEAGLGFAGILPPIWPALLAGVIVGALCTVASGAIDAMAPRRALF